MEFTYDDQGFPATVTHPRYIYKYISGNENSLSALENRCLWFSHPSAFNDPFDCQNTLVFANNMKSIKKLVRAMYPVGRSYRIEMARNIARDPTFRQDIVKKIYQDTLSKIFICCFSEENANTLMWSHYADSHRGACLVFELGYLLVNGGLSPVQVHYTDNPVPLSVPDAFGSAPTPLTEHRIKQAMVGNKLKQWSYEREIRMVSSVKGKVAFDPRALVGIVIGARSSNDLRGSVKNIADTKYERVALIEAKLNPLLGTVDVDGFLNETVKRRAMAILGDPGMAHTTLYMKVDEP